MAEFLRFLDPKDRERLATIEGHLAGFRDKARVLGESGVTDTLVHIEDLLWLISLIESLEERLGRICNQYAARKQASDAWDKLVEAFDPLLGPLRVELFRILERNREQDTREMERSER